MHLRVHNSLTGRALRARSYFFRPVSFFPYRTKARRAEVTREERVFFPVERTGPPGGGRPAATLRALPVPSEPMSTNSNVVQQLYRLYSQLYTLYVLYTLTASKAHHALSPVPFSLKADPRILCPSGPRFAPPSPWWHMGSPPPIAASRRARCARVRFAHLYC